MEDCKAVRKNQFTHTYICVYFLACSLVCIHAQTAPLPSWNDTAPKKAVISFVEKVTKEGSPDFVPIDQRIATFDNDGTLWIEQPMYVQLAFILDRVKELAPKHPDWKTTQPFKGVLEADMKAVAATGEKGLMQLMAATHSGMTQEQFQTIITDWLATARHPKLKRPYTECIYQPMVELLSYLRANGFKTYIVSGGGVEFMRPWTEKDTEFHPSKSWAVPSRPNSRCWTGNPFSRDCRKSTLSTTKRESPSESISSSVGAR